MHLSSVVPLIGTIVALSVSGCTSEQESGVDNGAAAISHQEAARELVLHDQVLANKPASAENTKKLGIVKWDVYTMARKSFSGVIAFASDAAGDVRYAWILDVEHNAAIVLQYDKVGMLRGKEVSADTIAALKVDFSMLDGEARAALAATKNGMSSGARCALRLTAAVLAVGATVAIGWYAYAAAEFLLSNYLTFTQLEIVSSGAVVATAASMGTLIAKETEQTFDLCADALSK